MRAEAEFHAGRKIVAGLILRIEMLVKGKSRAVLQIPTGTRAAHAESNVRRNCVALIGMRGGSQERIIVICAFKRKSPPQIIRAFTLKCNGATSNIHRGGRSHAALS